MAKVTVKDATTTIEVEGHTECILEVCDKVFQKYPFWQTDGDTEIAESVDPTGLDDLEHDVVAIYDDFGIPSIMHRFRKVTNKELFGGSDKTNAAFIIDGIEYDEIYIGVYDGCNINGHVYSLPYQKPWTNCTQDEFAEACFAKGAGWHMMTAVEYGLIANLSLKNGTLPHGNTASGRYHADKDEYGTVYDGHYTLTGSGPATWTHDHTMYGVHDMCGNIWQMVRGTRLHGDVIQAAKDNDAALPKTDLSLSGDGWHDVVDDVGNTVRIGIFDQRPGIYSALPEGYHANNHKGCFFETWQEADEACKNSEQLKELAIYGGEPRAYFCADTSRDERSAIRGGRWSSGALGGVFYLNFAYSRSSAHGSIGGRPAYFKRKLQTGH